jgi:uncharacterized protein (DUF433 family)
MPLDWTDHLTSDPGVLDGQLCATGTRIPVSVILDALAEGATPADVLRSYLTLRPVHVRAAIAYAAALAREEQLTPLSHARKARREPSRRAR